MEKYGGATFEELMENDINDDAVDAAIRTSFAEKRRREEGPMETDFEVIKDKNLAN